MTVLQFPARVIRADQSLSMDEEWEIVEKLHKDVADLLHRLGEWGRNEQRAQNFIRFHFGVSNHWDLTIGQMKSAIPLLQESVAQAAEFSLRLAEISRIFDEQVIGRGVPWTPWIARKLGRRRMSQEGKSIDWEALLAELEIGLPAPKARR